MCLTTPSHLARAVFHSLATLLTGTGRVGQGNASATDTAPLLGLLNVSSDRCAVGYTGPACRTCVRPGYYRLGSVCTACPRAAYGVVVVYMLAFGAFAQR